MRSGGRLAPVRRRFWRAGAGWALVLVVAGGLSGRMAGGQSPEDNPLHTASRLELDVVKVLLAQERAWNRGDLEGYMQGFKNSPETLVVARQVSKGYGEILTEYKQDFPNKASMGMLGYSQLEVHPLSDTFAVCIGHYHLERTKKEGGSADGLFSAVFEKTDAGWKIVVDHTS
jgi:ketosteroid isomerase-like protein